MSPEPADVVDRQWRAVVAALRLADDGAWRAPTRLAGWDVTDLARHVHWGVWLETEALGLVGDGSGRRAAGRDAPGTREALREPGPARRALVDGLDAARDELVARLRALPRDGQGTVPMPYGDLPLALAPVVFTMEATVHRSDLAAALGPATPAGSAVGSTDLDPDGLAAVATFLETFWPVLAQAGTAVPPAGTTLELRGESTVVRVGFDGVAWGAASGPATTTVRGPDSEVLLWALGRRPLGPPLAVTGDVTHAERLKSYLPGP